LETAVKGRADVIATFNVGEISWQIQGISWQIQAAAGRGWRA
jgi:hypothetical protein